VVDWSNILIGLRTTVLANCDQFLKAARTTSKPEDKQLEDYYHYLKNNSDTVLISVLSDLEDQLRLFFNSFNLIFSEKHVIGNESLGKPDRKIPYKVNAANLFEFQ
jgi:hypothetical protein